jgi:hypothetical protein
MPCLPATIAGHLPAKQAALIEPCGVSCESLTSPTLCGKMQSQYSIVAVVSGGAVIGPWYRSDHSTPSWPLQFGMAVSTAQDASDHGTGCW